MLVLYSWHFSNYAKLSNGRSAGLIRLPLVSEFTFSLFWFKRQVPYGSLFLARGRSSLSLGKLMAVKYATFSRI